MAKSPARRPQKPTARRAPKTTAQDRLVSTVERLRAHEARLETILCSSRDRIAAALAKGTVAAGGFSSGEEMVGQVLPDHAFLGTLRSEAFGVATPGGEFAAYVRFVEELRGLERQAQAELARARAAFDRLERGAFRDGGYRSYEDMLDRVLSGLPRLATASLLTETSPQRAPAPLQASPPALPKPPPRRLRGLGALGLAVAALVAVAGVSFVGRRVHAVPVAPVLAPGR